MRHIPRSSRIFIGILIIAMLLTYIVLHFSTYVADYTLRNSPDIKTNIRENINTEQLPKVNTADWVSYEDDTRPITFLHPENWKVTGSLNDRGFYEIVLNPGTRFYDMYIYVSDKSYYGLDGFKQTPIAIGDKMGFKVYDNLFGIKVGETYYTFDGTFNATQSAELYTLLDTVKFESSLLQE